MTRMRHVVTLMLFVVLLGGMASACATTGVGKAVQASDVQKQLVEAAAVEFAKAHLCTNHPAPPPKCQGRPVLTDATYLDGKAAYQKWEKSQRALASAIATWKVVKSADNEQKLQATLNTVRTDMDDYLKLIGAFVDIPALQKKAGG